MTQSVERQQSLPERRVAPERAAHLAQGASLAAARGLAGAVCKSDARAGHERKGEPMSEQQNGNPPKQGGNEQAARPRETIFDRPAPAGAAKKTSEVLGEIVWLMSQSGLHKQFFISDLEWLVM